MFTRRVVVCVAPTINSNSVDKAVLGGGAASLGHDPAPPSPGVAQERAGPRRPRLAVVHDIASRRGSHRRRRRRRRRLPRTCRVVGPRAQHG